MRIAISADWQFDVHARFGNIGPLGPSRLPDYIEAWVWTCGKAVRLGCAGMAVLGDVFNDRSSLDVLVIEEVAKAIRKSASPEFPIYLMCGNHDTAMRSSEHTSLSMFRGLPNIKVIAKPTIVQECLYFLPWSEDHASLSDALTRIHPSSKRDGYLFGHALLDGAVPVGGVPLDVFQLHKFKKAFFGDVHQPIEIGENAFYTGVPLHQSFADAIYPPGFIVLDTDTGEHRRIENKLSPRFIDAHVKGDMSSVRPIDMVRWSGDPEKWPEVEPLLNGAKCEGVRVARKITPVRVPMKRDDSFDVIWGKYLDYRQIPEPLKTKALKAGMYVWQNRSDTQTS